MKSMAHDELKAGRVPTENAPRDCGSCNVCCTAMHVRALNKPPGERCQSQGPTGCGIYADRPAACREWFCLWVRDPGQVFDTTHRPDRLGVFFTASPPDGQTGRQRMYAHEVRPGAAHEPKAAQAIGFLERVAPVQIIPFAGDRPPAVTQVTLRGRDVA